MNSFYRQVLIGTVLGALFLGGFAHVVKSREKTDPLGKYLNRQGIGTPVVALAGAVAGALVGTVVGLFGKKYQADLARFSKQNDWPFFEKIPDGMLCPYQALLGEAKVYSPRNLMVAGTAGQKSLVLDATVWEKGEWAPQGGRVQKTVVLVPGSDTGLAAFHLAPRPPFSLGPMVSLLSGAINLLTSGKGFHKNYEMLFAGRPADANIAERILGEDGLAFFASSPGWTVSCRDGHLLVWREAMAECKASERPTLVAQAHSIRDLLCKSPAALHRQQDLAHA
jgi:hypothetical protein